jgi:hypothetical protein
MNEHLLGGGDGYQPAIYIHVPHVVLAVRAESINDPQTQQRKDLTFTAERVPFSPEEWREHYGDIHLTIHRKGVPTFSTWIDMREAQALESIRHLKGERVTIIPREGQFWGSRIVKIDGRRYQALSRGTPLNIQRRAG